VSVTPFFIFPKASDNPFLIGTVARITRRTDHAEKKLVVLIIPFLIDAGCRRPAEEPLSKVRDFCSMPGGARERIVAEDIERLTPSLIRIDKRHEIVKSFTKSL
jgi:hypothetical protein